MCKKHACVICFIGLVLFAVGCDSGSSSNPSTNANTTGGTTSGGTTAPLVSTDAIVSIPSGMGGN